MFSRRIDRTGFLVGSALVFGPLVLTMGMYTILYYIAGGNNASGADIFHGLTVFVLFFLWIVWALLLLPIYFGLMIRRLHDLNLTGWLAVLQLVPMVNIALYLYLLIFPGSSGRNHYGEPDSPRDPQGILFAKTYMYNKPIEPADMKTPPLDIPPPQ